MSKSARRLGRGLSSLVSDYRTETEPGQQPVMVPARPESPTESQSAIHTQPDSRLRAEMVRPDQLTPNPCQPRSNVSDESVTSLAESIRQSGLLQPITARLKNGRYEIIAGERRWRAARKLRLLAVPVLLRDATDEQMLEFALVENIQREDLNAIDRARGYREFCQRFGAKPEQLAKRLGEDRSTVANYLRLLDLPPDVQTMVAQRELSMGHARCLLGISDDARRRKLAGIACENDLSVRALEEIVRREKKRATVPDDATPATTAKARSPHLQEMIRRFEERVKSKVVIQESRRTGVGRIVLHYYSLDDFDRISALLGVEAD